MKLKRQIWVHGFAMEMDDSFALQMRDKIYDNNRVGRGEKKSAVF